MWIRSFCSEAINIDLWIKFNIILKLTIYAHTAILVILHTPVTICEFTSWARIYIILHFSFLNIPLSGKQSKQLRKIYGNLSSNFKEIWNAVWNPAYTKHALWDIIYHYNHNRFIKQPYCNRVMQLFPPLKLTVTQSSYSNHMIGCKAISPLGALSPKLYIHHHHKIWNHSNTMLQK